MGFSRLMTQKGCGSFSAALLLLSAASWTLPSAMPTSSELSSDTIGMQSNLTSSVAIHEPTLLYGSFCVSEFEGKTGTMNSSSFTLHASSTNNALSEPSNPFPIEIELDRTNLPLYLSGLRLTILRSPGTVHGILSQTNLQGATMLAMNAAYSQSTFPHGPMDSVRTHAFPVYGDEARAVAYNIDPRGGGAGFGLTWGVAMYATRGLGEWLAMDWRTQAIARVHEKVGTEWRYRGCVWFEQAESISVGEVNYAQTS